MKRADRLEQILDCLNKHRIRATYGAVGEVLRVPAQSVGRILGHRSRRASWVVAAATGQPTGYSEDLKHPDLLCRRHIIISGMELRRLLDG